MVEKERSGKLKMETLDKVWFGIGAASIAALGILVLSIIIRDVYRKGKNLNINRPIRDLFSDKDFNDTNKTGFV